LQDALKVSQQGPGTFDIPNWDEPSLKESTCRAVAARETISDTKRMFGANKDQVDPVRHLVGTALVWAPSEKDGLYLPVTPARNDGPTIHKLTVKDVPVDGFWSITVYNAEGYFEPNHYKRLFCEQYHRQKGSGRVGCRPVRRLRERNPNCLPIMKGWNYTVRLFRPATRNPRSHMEIPRAQPVN